MSTLPSSRDPSDIVGKISLAPFSKQTMHMLEYGGIEKAFCLPSTIVRHSSLSDLFSNSLITSTEIDASEEETKDIMTSGVDSETTRVKTLAEEAAASRPVTTAECVVEGGVFVEFKKDVADVKDPTEEGMILTQNCQGEGLSTDKEASSTEQVSNVNEGTSVDTREVSQNLDIDAHGHTDTHGHTDAKQDSNIQWREEQGFIIKNNKAIWLTKLSLPETDYNDDR